MPKTHKIKSKTLIAAALIAVAGLIGIGVSDAHAGGKHRYDAPRYETDRYKVRHRPTSNVVYRSDRSSDRLGAAIAELFVFAATGDIRSEYVGPPRRWKRDKHRGYAFGKTCFPVKKVVRGPYGKRRIVHGTACRDAYGNIAVIPGSRYVVRYDR